MCLYERERERDRDRDRERNTISSISVTDIRTHAHMHVGKSRKTVNISFRGLFQDLVLKGWSQQRLLHRLDN